jgi:hypothetical protein
MVLSLLKREESYTSKASFLDNDSLPKFGEKPEGWQPSGKRTKRGLYRTAQNEHINADANGATNIIRKVSREAQLFVGWVSGSVNYADVGFHASTVRLILAAEAQPTFILYLIPPTHFSTTLNFNLSRVSRGVLTRPQKFKFWSAKKTLRNVVLTRW